MRQVNDGIESHLREMLRLLGARRAAVLKEADPETGLASIVLDDEGLPKEYWTIGRIVNSDYKPSPVTEVEVVVNPCQGDVKFYSPLESSEKAEVVRLAKSVGGIKDKDNRLLGTAFVVKTNADGGGVIATNCHVISESSEMRDGRRILTEKLFVDFAATEDSSDGGVYVEIDPDVLSYGQAPCFDVAFLSVKNGDIPPALPLNQTRIESEGNSILLLGLPDLSNVNENSNNPYIRYKDSGTRKFVVPGGITGIDKSHPQFDVLRHVASTEEGQSGSPIFDRNNFTVIGIHNCCRTFYEGNPVENSSPDFPCASIKTTLPNQAISIWSILHDPTLGPHIIG